MKKKNYNGTLEMKLFPYFLVLPNTLIFLFFIIIPTFFGIYYSLTSWKGIGAPEFVGFRNYIRAFGDKGFWQSMYRTASYTIMSIPLLVACPLFIANIMVKTIRGKSLFRAIFYWPAMISPIVVGLSFKFIFGDSTGIINYFLEKIGSSPIAWMSNQSTAYFVVILVTIWSRIGFYMVTYIAGLNNIPITYYEAARVDGATQRQSFFKITLPLLKPTTFLVFMLGFIDLFKAYPLILSLTGAYAGTNLKFVVRHIYEEAFTRANMGYASALSMIMLVILCIFTTVQFYYNRGGRVI